AGGTLTVDGAFWNTDTSGHDSAFGLEEEVGGATGLTTAEFEDSLGFIATASAEGWDFEAVWAPLSAGYTPELYATSPVVWIEAEKASRTYGGANPAFTADLHGGTALYRFGPVDDTLDLGEIAWAADASSPAGTYSNNADPVV